MSLIAEWIGVSRAAIYKSQKRFDAHRELREQIPGFVKTGHLINKKMDGTGF